MVLSNITNLVNQIFQPMQIRSVVPVQSQQSHNPFSNPFFGEKENNSNLYGKNKPVSGGYFAGYYNGQPNIVGTRLFLEV